MSRRYDSLDDLNHDLDRESILDTEVEELDPEDLALITPRRVPAAKPVPARRGRKPKA